MNKDCFPWNEALMDRHKNLASLLHSQEHKTVPYQGQALLSSLTDYIKNNNNSPTAAFSPAIPGKY